MESLSFIIAISPETKQSRYETASSLGDFQSHQRSRTRATDVPAGCSSNDVSCGVWFHTGVCGLPINDDNRLCASKEGDWATCIGAKNRTQTFFSQTFRALPGYPGKIPGYPRQKSLIPWVSRDIPNFLARGRPPTPPENIRTQKFGFGFFFRA